MRTLNKKKKFIIFFILGIALLSTGVFFTLNNFNNNKTPQKETIIINDNTIANRESTSYKEWDPTTTYNKGDKVSYNGKIYESKWWTQGESPESNSSTAWTLIGDADVNIKFNDDDDIESPSTENLSNSDFKVVGYFPEWKPNKEKEIQYSKLTHINYSFAIPNSDGTIKDLDNPDLAKKIIKKGHSNGVKVLLAVGGWEYNGSPLENTFIAATDSDSKCKKLANSIISTVDKYGFDGVDMDWEHPRTDGNSKNQYASLLKYLKEGLKKKDKLLTAAVQAGVNADGVISWDAAGHLDSALDTLDWINVMAYDGGDGDRHSSYDFAVNSANYWRKTRKLPASKVVLGVPFYGRPSWASYEDILKADNSAYRKDKATIDGKEAYYNGIDTIKKKTEWAKDNVSGIMIWEISQDTTDNDKSLINAIYETIK
ncbi:glycosyl hydrolase family 18 protein [Clostridium sp. LP20]|uniref:glycosyl hydrolase family 18 protein n=1 Tax=Clostridium sp. LP20 TaxID=3418665 RepID=UPI003EE4799A